MTATQDPNSPTVPDDLNDAERDLLAAAATGEVVDLRIGDTDLDKPANAADWEDNRNVRADFLGDLLTGGKPTSLGRLRSVKLRGARITGTLDLEARKILCPVLLQDCYFNQAINLAEAEAISIRLPGCRVPGINAEQLGTVGNVEFDDGFASRGEIRLLGARIGGQLNLGGASLANDDGVALDADGLTVDQGMLCRDGLTTHGEVRLIGALIGRQLSFTGAKLTAGKSGYALSADRLTVGGHMLCRDGFTVHGEVLLNGAHIGGQLSFKRAELTAGKSGYALSADSLTVDQSMFCHDRFIAHGEITMTGAHIGGQLRFRGATLINDRGPALTANGLSAGGMMLCDGGFTAKGGVDLTNAKVGAFYDDQGSWPDRLWIRGFTYEGFGTQGVGTRARLEWLRRHDGPFTPQIYDQLADVYRRAGDDGAARKVLVAKQWRRRKPYNPLRYLWWVTVGYGYRTWQAFIWATVLTVVGALVFSGTYPAHMVKLTAHPPRFQPVIYALDVLLPIGGLGQKSAWQPTGGYLDWYWGLAIAGWVLSAAVVAGLTGILKRD